MAQWVVRNWGRGVDSRRPVWDADPDVLLVGQDVVLTNDGQIEKRKKFVSKYGLPAAQTFGLFEKDDELYVCGSVATPAPAVPAGVNYLRLMVPGVLTIVRVLSWDLFDGKFYIAALMSDGSTQHYYDGDLVTDWFDGRSRGSFAVTGGSAGGGNQVTSVRVNGVEVLSVAVTWATSNVDTAEAIAAQITSYVSAPDYTAVAINGTVIIAALAGADANGFAVEVTVTGNVTVSSVSAMVNGVPSATSAPGDFVKTVDDKMYSPSGSYLNFSGIKQPTLYNTDTLGAGFINLANHASNSTLLQALEEFLDRIAVFARKAILIWYIDPDPEEYQKAQTIKHNGTYAPRSVKQYRDSDIFFFADSGPSALRVAGTAEVVGAIEDVGAPIMAEYNTIRDAISATTASEGFSFVDPVSKRLWMALGNFILVFNYYPERRVAGWTIFDIGYQITDIVSANRRIYARSGDVIYLYGGDDDNEYLESEAVVRLPCLTINAPANFKNFLGFDYGVEGLWEVKLYTDEKDTTGVVQARVFEPTFNKGTNPSIGGSTQGFLEFRSKDSGYATIRSVVLHYELDVSN